MTTSTKRVELGRQGVIYIQDYLMRGRTLARRLRDKDLSQGDVYTHLPIDLPTSKAFEFNAALGPADRSKSRDLGSDDRGLPLVAVPKPDLMEVLAEALGGLLANPAAVCLLEDDMSRPSDPWLKKVGHTLGFCGDEVYHKIPGSPSLATSDILSVVTSSFSVRLVDAISSVPLPAVDSPVDLSVNLLRRIADEAAVIVTGAYDQQGYVIWEENKTE